MLLLCWVLSALAGCPQGAGLARPSSVMASFRPSHVVAQFIRWRKFRWRKGNARCASILLQTESNSRRRYWQRWKSATTAAQGARGAGQAVLPRTGRSSARGPRHPLVAVFAAAAPQGWRDEVASTRNTTSNQDALALPGTLCICYRPTWQLGSEAPALTAMVQRMQPDGHVIHAAGTACVACRHADGCGNRIAWQPAREPAPKPGVLPL